MSDTLLCRLCWWAADLTRKQGRVWCSHAVHHGWYTNAPGCGGKAFRQDDDRT
jgi:hypothetical protein